MFYVVGRASREFDRILHETNARDTSANGTPIWNAVSVKSRPSSTTPLPSESRKLPTITKNPPSGGNVVTDCEPRALTTAADRRINSAATNANTKRDEGRGNNLTMKLSLSRCGCVASAIFDPPTRFEATKSHAKLHVIQILAEGQREPVRVAGGGGFVVV